MFIESFLNNIYKLESAQISTGERTNKMWFIYMMQYIHQRKKLLTHFTTYMNFKNNSKWKKPNAKDYILCDFFICNFQKI